MAKTVLVTGDLLIQENVLADNLARHIRPAHASEVTVCETRGGAWRLAQLAQIAMQIPVDEKGGTEIGPVANVVGPGESLPASRAIVLWKRFAPSVAKKLSSKNAAWRIDKILGIQRNPTIAPASLTSTQDTVPDIVLVEDLGLGFRDTPEAWPEALKHPADSTSIILCCHDLLCEGKLWEFLTQHCDRVTVVTSATALRLRGAALTSPLSWDQTIEEVATEMESNRFARDLARMRRVIVQFDTDGVASFTREAIDKASGQIQADRVHFERCLYDPEHLEGMWTARHQGLAIQGTSTLAVALARSAIHPHSYPLCIALSRALRALRKIHKIGGRREGGLYEAADLAARKALSPAKVTEKASYYTAFPHAMLDEQELKQQPSTKSNLLRDFTGAGLETTISTGIDVVLRGMDRALSPVPRARFANYFTVDRDEIERVNSIRNLIVNYLDNPSDTRPLSFAVFGPPGSGKSFAVKQLVHAVVGQAARSMEFNISQIKDLSELHQAFHRVRDATIQKRTPFVFWDEFDADDLQWLKHFLAPMQDSNFLAGGIEHAFGKAVFIFAGGTQAKLADFDKKEGDPAYEAFKKIKGPDFVSRLRGHIDVKGPNPEPGATGHAYIIRRAVLLRGLLEANFPHLIDSSTGHLAMDANVVRAFLTVGNYLRGARSLDAVVSMSNLRPVQRFGQAELPSKDLQQLHVSELLGTLATRDPQLGLDEIDILAAAAHDAWKATKVTRGYVYGDPRDDKAIPPRHPLLLDFAKLPAAAQESNRLSVRAALVAIGALGYRLTPSGPGATELHNLSQLSKPDLFRAEHDRWLRERLQSGWAYSEITADRVQLHRDVAHFTDLPVGEEVLDELVYQTMLTELPKLGFSLVKV